MEGSIAIVFLVITVIANIVKAVRKRQEQESRKPGIPASPARGGQPVIPYAGGEPAQRPAFRGFETFKELLKQLEDEDGEPPQPQPSPRPQPAPPVERSVHFGEGYASHEGEDTMHDTHRNPEPEIEPERIAPPAAAAFATGSDLRRAVVMSEVLGKPVSLRRR